MAILGIYVWMLGKIAFQTHASPRIMAATVESPVPRAFREMIAATT